MNEETGKNAPDKQVWKNSMRTMKSKEKEEKRNWRTVMEWWNTNSTDSITQLLPFVVGFLRFLRGVRFLSSHSSHFKHSVCQHSTVPLTFDVLKSNLFFDYQRLYRLTSTLALSFCNLSSLSDLFLGEWNKNIGITISFWQHYQYQNEKLRELGKNRHSMSLNFSRDH